jgi:hypothetical protein
MNTRPLKRLQNFSAYARYKNQIRGIKGALRHLHV